MRVLVTLFDAAPSSQGATKRRFRSVVFGPTAPSHGRDHLATSVVAPSSRYHSRYRSLKAHPSFFNQDKNGASPAEGMELDPGPSPSSDAESSEETGSESGESNLLGDLSYREFDEYIPYLNPATGEI